MKKPLMVVASTVLALLASFVPMSSANAADPVCTINVTESNIEVQGTNLGDVICITGDYNTVYSLGGGDTVVDDGIANTIFLGEGFDSYYGSGGSGSTVDGGPGDDEITGTPGPDEITGGEGDDTLIGGEEDDNLNGGLGADELAGDAGDDNLYGESGSDSLSGGDGDDILAGGDDIDTLAGGVGLNVCDYNTGEALTATCRYDDVGPVISEVSFSPSVVDVGSEAQTVELTMAVSDGTGVSDLSLSCNNEEAGYSLGAYLGGGGTHGGSYFSSIGNWQADITGNPTQLTAKFKIVVPLGIRPGVFRCSTYTTDKLANRDGWKSISQTLTVTRSAGTFDDVAPVISEVSFSPSVVDVGSEAQTVDLTMSVSDDTGVSDLSLSCNNEESGYSLGAYLGGGGTHGGSYFSSIGNWQADITGNPTQLTAKFKIVVPLGIRPGVFRCSTYTTDKLANRDGWKSISQTLTVTRSAGNFDDVGPVISEVSFSPSVVDVGSEAQTVELTMAVSDDTGVSDLSLSCNNEEAGYSLGAYLGGGGTHGGSYFSSIGNWQADITGNPTQLTAKFKIVVPLGIRPGVFRCSTYTTDKLANRDGWKPISQTLTIFRTPAGQPSSPRNLGFVSTLPTTGVMSWSEPEVQGNPALVGYVAEYSKDGESWLPLPKSGTKSTSLDISGLLADTDYWFRVRGENGGTIGQDLTYMNLNWSTVKIRTPAPVVPDSPTALLVSNVTSSGYKLAWSAPNYNGGSAITDFKVEVSSDGGNTWRLAKQSASTSLTLNVSGAAPGTNYLVRVGAINSVGISEYLTGSLITASTVPRTPRDVSSSNVSGTSLTLSWLLPSSNGGSAITDYKVEVSSNCTSYTVINRPVSVNLGFNVTGLKPGTKYCFRVSAGNSIGYSSPTQVFEVSTQGYPPAAPTSLSVKASKTSVTLGWKAAAGNGGSAVKNYIVEYSKNNGYTWIKVKKPISTSRTLVITGLKNMTTYLFRVTAVNDVGNSAASKNLKIVTLYSRRG